MDLIAFRKAMGKQTVEERLQEDLDNLLPDTFLGCILCSRRNKWQEGTLLRTTKPFIKWGQLNIVCPHCKSTIKPWIEGVQSPVGWDEMLEEWRKE